VPWTHPILRRSDLQHLRVELRRAIERQTQLLQWQSGDAIDNRLRLESLQLRLRSTETEWHELEGMLGQPHPLKPVKYRMAAVRLRTPGPYLNRMIPPR
jgi:hypothetical protein